MAYTCLNGDIITIGDTVCDCRYLHLKVLKIDEDGDLTLEDGAMCSADHCIDLVPHDWEHPSKLLIYPKGINE